MNFTYTFVSYLVYEFIIRNVICFELDVGKFDSYSSDSTDVTIQKISEFKNLFTHKLSKPTYLNGIHYRNSKIYFDNLLTNNQLLLSASVTWAYNNPSVVQLNLENSSILLVNDHNSSFKVQAIFSEKLVTNLANRIHSSLEPVVDVNLSSSTDYGTDKSIVRVANLQFSEDKLKRYTLRNYNLESTKLGRILFRDVDLKTLTQDSSSTTRAASQTTNTQQTNTQGTSNTESLLEIPSKNNVYSIQGYYYDNFPLLIEVLYTFQKRIFFGFTPEKKWHQVYLPSYEDPSYLDYLYKTLNYYACRNGFKVTINIAFNHDDSSHLYSIANYCIGPNHMDSILNNMKSTIHATNELNTDQQSCFEHSTSDNKNFFVDHLMYNSSVIQLKDTPKVIKCIRVYHHHNYRPYLIVFVDDSDKLHYYKYQKGEWSFEKTVSNVAFDARFTNDIRTLVAKLMLEDVKVTANTVVVLTDQMRNYDKDNIMRLVENRLSSASLVDNIVAVSDETQSLGACLNNFKLFKQDLTNSVKIASQEWEKTDFNFLLYLGNSNINFYENNTSDEPMTMTYKKNYNDLYIFYFGNGNLPVLMCFEGNVFRPKDKMNYSTKWVKVTNITKCTCETGTTTNNTELSKTLTDVLDSLNAVNAHQRPPTGQDYPLCKLMVKYEFTPMGQQNGINLDVYKSADSKLTLKPDGTYATNPYSRSEVYYNKYDETNTPLILAVHFTESVASRYYRMSSFDTDKANAKNISTLDEFRDDSALLIPLLAENDTLSNLLTYRLDQKTTTDGQNKYNGGKISLAKDQATDLESNGFSKYTHTPTANNDSKKACVLFNNDAPVHELDNQMTLIEAIQNVVFTSVVVYHSNRAQFPLLVQYNKKEGGVEYYYHRKKSNTLYWHLLDDKEYNRLLKEEVGTSGIHSKLTGTDNKLIPLLQKIEFEMLDSIIILAEKQESYMKTVVDAALVNSSPALIPNPAASETQPEQTNVTNENQEKLQERNFSMYEHKINFQTDRDSLSDKIELRLLLKTGTSESGTETTTYTEALLHKADTTNASIDNREYIFFNKTAEDNNATTLYTYFYGTEKNPFLLCYGNQAYKLLNKETGIVNWVRVKDMETCKFNKTDDNTKLLETLSLLIQCLSVANMNERPLQTDVDNSNKLFMPFVYRLSNPGPCNVNLYKEKGGQDKMVFSNDPNNRNYAITHEEVFYNRYSSYNHPLLMLVHFESNSTPKKYYQLANYETDKSSPKNITDLPDFTTEEALTDLMLEYNDTIHDTVTYQLDKKDNRYNSKRVIVEEFINSPKVGFTKYVHRPASGYENKKAFAVNNHTVLTWWNKTTNKPVDVKWFQGELVNSVNVYFSQKTGMLLLVAFERQNTTQKWEYYYERKFERGLYWQVLDEDASNMIMGKKISRTNAHTELTKDNNKLLTELLVNIESTAMNTLVLLIDKQTQYVRADVGTAILNTMPKLTDIQTVTGGQPPIVTPTPVDFKIHKSSNYKCFSQTVHGNVSDDLKLLIPTVDMSSDVNKYAEISLYDSEGNTKVALTYKTGSNVLYTYFYGSDPRPLLICYENKAYKPKKLGEPERARQVYVDYKTWLHVPEITNCVPNGGESTANTEKILNALNEVTNFTNPVMINIERIPRHATKLLTETKTSNHDVYYLHEYTKSTVVKMKISVNDISSYRYFTFEPAGTGDNGAGYRLGEIIYQPLSGASSTFRLNYMAMGSPNKYRPMVRAVVYYYKHDIDFKDPLIIQLEFQNDVRNNDTIKEYYKLNARTYSGSERMEWDTHSEIAETLKEEKKLMDFMDDLRYRFKNSLRVELYHRTVRYEFKVSEAYGEGDFRGALKTAYIPVEEPKCEYLNLLKFHVVRHRITQLEDSYLADVSRLKMVLPVKEKFDTWLKFYDENEKLLDKMVYNSSFGDVYVYHYDKYNLPLLICFLNKTYFSKNRNSYYNYDWYQLKGVTKCGCDVTNHTERQIIVDKLNDAVSFLEILDNISRRATDILFPYMDGETIKSMGDSAIIKSLHGDTDRIPTFKATKHLKATKKFRARDFDIYWFSWYEYNDLLTYKGHLSGKMSVSVNTNFGINALLYYRNRFLSFGSSDVYAQRVEYRYDSKQYYIYVDVYTNVLLVYSFKVEYSRSSGKWTYLGFKTMNIIQQVDLYRSYYERLKYINQLDFEVNFDHPLIR